MKRLLLCMSLCFLFAGFVRAAYADYTDYDELNEDAIHALYARRTGAVGNPDKTSAMMDDTLDDFYVLKSNLTQTIGDAPPKTSSSTFDKTQAIQNVIRGYNVMKVDRYESNIEAIKLSDRKDYAYVTTSTASSGTISVPLPEGGYKASDYQDGESCVDQVAIIHEKLKFVQSVCNENFVVKQ